MEQAIKELIEKNYKFTTVEGVCVEGSELHDGEQCVILRCITTSYRCPLIAQRILNTYPRVRLVHFTGGWIEAVYTRETLKWAGYRIVEHKK